jgi:hypothetical protein
MLDIMYGSSCRKRHGAIAGKHLLHLYQDDERFLELLFSLWQDIDPSFEGLACPRTYPLLTYSWIMPLFMGRLNKGEGWGRGNKPRQNNLKKR